MTPKIKRGDPLAVRRAQRTTKGYDGRYVRCVPCAASVIDDLGLELDTPPEEQYSATTSGNIRTDTCGLMRAIEVSTRKNTITDGELKAALEALA